MQNTFLKTLKGELIKIKRSAIYTLALVLGALLPVVFVLVNIIDGDYATNPVVPNKSFFKDLFDTLLQGLTGFFLPLLIIIIASKIAQLDHKNKGWQLMETQPVTSFSIFFSKFVILLYSVFKALIFYIVSVLFFGWLYTLVIDIDENYSMAIPWEHLLYVISRVFIASLAVVALQYTIAVLLPSFIWSLVVGFGMLLGQLFVAEFNVNMRWFPYNFLYVSGTNPDGGQLGRFLLKAESLSLVYTAAFLFIGYNWYRFKGFINAFIKKPARLTTALVTLAIASALSYTLIKTVQLAPTEKTVIKGSITADRPLKQVYLIDELTADTLMVMPVFKNTFRAVYTKTLPANTYILQYDNYSQQRLFMSEKDSIQIAFSFLEGRVEQKITGTRITENLQSAAYSDGNFSYINYRLEENVNLEDTAYYMKGIIEEYNDDINDLTSKVSVDHVVAREDYLDISRALIAVKYAQVWKDYLKKKDLYLPNLKVKPSREIQTLLAQVNMNNETLLTNKKYVDYLTTALMAKPGIDSTETTLERIAALKPSSFKDKWLFTNLVTALETETVNSKRDSVLNKFKGSFKNARFVELATLQSAKLNKLNTGEPAIDFAAVNKNGKSYTLAGFKGSYVLIDTWASWCAPCKYQEPFYVRKFEKYKKHNVIFISLNVDTKENKWHENLVTMNQDILQLRPKDIDFFTAAYELSSIPRFMLFSKEGTILDSNFTMPSDKNFDDLLDLKLEIQKP